MSAESVLLVPGSWHGGWVYDGVAERLTDAGVAVTAIDLPSNDGASGLADDAAAVATGAREHQRANGGRRPLLRRHRRERRRGRISQRGRPRLSRGVHARHGRVAARRHAAPAPRLDRARRGRRLAHRQRSEEVLYGDCSPEVAADATARLPRQSVAAIATPQTRGRVAEPAEQLPDLRRGPRRTAAGAGGDVSNERQTVRRVPSSHSPFFSRPGDVAEVVLQALGRSA